MITKTDIENFVNKLEPYIQNLYFLIEDEVLSIRDTSSDEFQIAVKLNEVFWNYVRDRNDEK